MQLKKKHDLKKTFFFHITSRTPPSHYPKFYSIRASGCEQQMQGSEVEGQAHAGGQSGMACPGVHKTAQPGPHLGQGSGYLPNKVTRQQKH